LSEPARGATVRAAAARVVRAVRFQGISLKAALPAALTAFDDARDRALCEAMCFESARWALRYERVLARLVTRPLPRSLQDVHALLLVGLAQLDAMRLPDYAALSSTAEAARCLRHPRHVALVNAVLRRFLRERESLEHDVASEPVAWHAHPDWLIRALRDDWGDAADAILEHNNRAAPTWLRVNLRQGSRETYRAALIEAGIESTPDPHADSALRVDQGVVATRLPGW
jgi:16S rRNA (cytosine967-C5)-methyltransferase